MIKEWCDECKGTGIENDNGLMIGCYDCHGKGYTELEPEGEVEIVEHCIEVNGVYEPTSHLTIDYEGDMTTFKTVDEALAWAKRHNFKVAKIFDLKTRGNFVVTKEIFEELKE